MNIKEILQKAVEHDATDVHLVSGSPPIFRVHGNLTPGYQEALSSERLEELILGMLTAQQKQTFQENQELDFSFGCLNDFYLRVNVHVDKGNLAATVRIMPTKIRSFEELGIPDVVKSLADKRKGLVLVIGPAGSGKTTTLTCLLDLINRERKAKIITVEDPIEYIHQSKQSLVIQREVGSDTKSFLSALKYAVRQDPDVVMIGEMRDLESISMALTTAETGHLVLTTLHAPDCIESINRIIDVYPTGQQSQIRVQLAENLLAVIGQTLIPREDQEGRILATEILMANFAIRNMIRRGSLMEIRGHMETSHDSGMHTLEQCLADLVRKKILSKSTAKDYAKYPNLI